MLFFQLESRLLSDSSEEMYRSIVDMGRKKYGQEMIPENILVAAKSCSNIEVKFIFIQFLCVFLAWQSPRW